MLQMKKCYNCGKEFMPAINHIYKSHLNGKKAWTWFCSYGCWRNCGGDNKRKRDGVQGY